MAPSVKFASVCKPVTFPLLLALALFCSCLPKSILLSAARFPSIKVSVYKQELSASSEGFTAFVLLAVDKAKETAKGSQIRVSKYVARFFCIPLRNGHHQGAGLLSSNR